MKQLGWAAVTLALGITPASLGFGQQAKGVAQTGTKVTAQQSHDSAQAQRAEHEVILSLTSTVSEMRQQLAEQQRLTRELKAAQDERVKDSAIQEHLVTYTRWLVYVGVIQFVAL